MTMFQDDCSTSSEHLLQGERLLDFHFLLRVSNPIFDLTLKTQDFLTDDTRPKPFVVAYNYSKAGVLVLTRTVALHCAEMGYKIRCNAVQPGAINTPMMQRYVQAAENPDQQLSEFAASHPMNRVGEPDEVVNAVLFLASDDSAFTTGDSISVDGGVIAI